MCVVIGAFIFLAIKYIFKLNGWSGLFSFKPFYNPSTFNLGAILTATSFAALTYIGFDGVTTLAKTLKIPGGTCFWHHFSFPVYRNFQWSSNLFGTIGPPDYGLFLHPETAFYDVSARVGGILLFNAMALILFVALGNRFGRPFLRHVYYLLWEEII